MTRSLRLLGLLAGTTALAASPPSPGARADDARPRCGTGQVTEGALFAADPEGRPLGACPLEHTDVGVEISGPVARVLVTQRFTNPFTDKIEAIYTFPLGATGAVSDMTMKVGDRTIVGEIKSREEARATYERARDAGYVASLLDEERPNIFTQSVANIEPGAAVEIEITYTEILEWKDGTYAFTFPMVVGPRYIPGGAPGAFMPASAGTPPIVDEDPGFRPGGSHFSSSVPDAGRITPPVTPKGTRTGHDISLRVALDAGSPIRSIRSLQHAVQTTWPGDDRTRAVVELARRDEIPNKDFVLQFTTSSARIQDAFLAHTDERGGFFTFVLQPPERVQPKDIVPREIVFVIDTSGSQHGFPLDISRRVMRRAIENLRQRDRFNLITFAGNTSVLWPEARPNTEANRRDALAFVETLRGGGGTEMMRAIDAALGGTHDPETVRIVAFFTDGYVGNDMEIVDAVQKYAGVSRVFSFGIGTSVNRYLLDEMARAGRGEVSYALNPGQAEEVADRFYQRIDAPVLTDVTVDWGDLAKHVELADVYPAHIPDLFSVKPLVVKGRYDASRSRRGEITLRGRTASGPFERRIAVTLPASAPGNEALAPLWARARVDDLMNRDLVGAQRGNPDAKVKQAVTALGITYHLLTPYTSFVAVEERIVTAGGEARTVRVPVEMPEGVSYEGVFGEAKKGEGGWAAGGAMMGTASAKTMAAMPTMRGPAAGGPQTPVVSRRHAAEEVSLRELDSVGYLGSSLRDDRAERARPLTEEERRQATQAKIDPSLWDLARRLDEQGDYRAGAVVVRGGRVELAVAFDRLDEEVRAALRSLGWKTLMEASQSPVLVGTIEVARIEELARMDAVLAIAPPQFVEARGGHPPRAPNGGAR